MSALHAAILKALGYFTPAVLAHVLRAGTARGPNLKSSIDFWQSLAA
jgi:hypothetical protein